MNTKKFKAMLFSCVIGVAGCNKIANPSYMDGGGDREEESKEKRRKIGDSCGDSKAGTSSDVAVSEGSTIDHSKMLDDILCGMKEDADLAEEIARDKEKDIERAIKRASNAKVRAEIVRKTADDAEKRRANPIPGIDAFHQRALDDILCGMKEDADLAEEIARDKEKDVERAIKRASNAKVRAEIVRKTADDAEKRRLSLGGDGASTSSGVTRKSVDDKEKESRVGLGPGGDTL